MSYKIPNQMPKNIQKPRIEKNRKKREKKKKPTH